jgi:hypothetical protein
LEVDNLAWFEGKFGPKPKAQAPRLFIFILFFTFHPHGGKFMSIIWMVFIFSFKLVIE